MTVERALPKGEAGFERIEAALRFVDPEKWTGIEIDRRPHEIRIAQARLDAPALVDSLGDLAGVLSRLPRAAEARECAILASPAPRWTLPREDARKAWERARESMWEMHTTPDCGSLGDVWGIDDPGPDGRTWPELLEHYAECLNDDPPPPQRSMATPSELQEAASGWRSWARPERAVLHDVDGLLAELESAAQGPTQQAATVPADLADRLRSVATAVSDRFTGPDLIWDPVLVRDVAKVISGTGRVRDVDKRLRHYTPPNGEPVVERAAARWVYREHARADQIEDIPTAFGALSVRHRFTDTAKPPNLGRSIAHRIEH